jgi:hypothetical protein
MVLAPLLFLTGILLRLRFHFFFPQQLAAFNEHPALITASYNFFLAGNIALWPAITGLAHLIGQTRPHWAAFGGCFVIFGLFARTFHAGADFLAFQMVRLHGPDFATKTVAGSYGGFHVVSALNGAILFGWILLAIGAYLSRTLGLIQSMALGLMAALMMGVLKGSSTTSVVAATGLGIALVPLGIQLLRAPPHPRPQSALAWSAAVSILVLVLFVLGRLG